MNCEPILKLDVVEKNPLFVGHVAKETLSVAAASVRHAVFEFFEDARSKRCFDSGIELGAGR